MQESAKALSFFFCFWAAPVDPLIEKKYNTSTHIYYEGEKE